MWRTRGIGGLNPNEKAADSKSMIAISATVADRHCRDPSGTALPYKGYVGGSNFCLEIFRNPNNRWTGEVVSTFAAYQIARKHGPERLHHPTLSQNGAPLLMRLMINDSVKFEVDGQTEVVRVVKIDPSTNVVFADLRAAGELKKRHDDPHDSFRYVNMRGEAFRTAKARRVVISPIGELRDPGFKE